MQEEEQERRNRDASLIKAGPFGILVGFGKQFRSFVELWDTERRRRRRGGGEEEEEEERPSEECSRRMRKKVKEGREGGREDGRGTWS